MKKKEVRPRKKEEKQLKTKATESKAKKYTRKFSSE